MTFYFGSHNKVSKGLLNAAEDVYNAGGNFIQIFLHIPTSSKALDNMIEEFKEFKNYLLQHNMKVVVHSDYIHNLAKNWDAHSWWLKNIELEIKYAHLIGAIGLVIHFGKQLDLSIQEAYNNMYTSLIYIHNKTKEHKDIKIFLETSTGMGSEICYKLEDLSYFYKKISMNPNKELKDRIKLCVDTCHIFAAGYDLKTKMNVKMYLEAFEELIGIRYISLIHLNDCKVDRGCQKDRHEGIGKGFIGYEGLKHFFDYFRKLNIPIILETPGDHYKTEIRMLRQ